MLKNVREVKTGIVWLLAIGMAASLAFIGLGSMGAPQRTAGGDVLAEIDGVQISFQDFARERQNIISRYRQFAGENFEQIARTVDFEQLAWENVKSSALLLADAERRGLTVTDEEIRQAIWREPFFQGQGGSFDKDRYESILRQQRLNPAQFENNVRRDLKLGKVRTIYRDTVAVSREEVYKDFVESNEKITVEHITLQPRNFESEVDLTDEQIRVHYEKDPEKWIVPTRVKFDYIYVRPSVLTDQVTVEDSEVEEFYEANKAERYTQQEEVQARHVLIRVGQDAPEAEVEEARRKAIDIAQRARAGEDFAMLAEEFSDDPGSAARGGDLGFFGRGRMVPEFETTAFTLAIDEISDPVRSQFGFHVIQTTDRKEPSVQPLSEVRDTVEQELRRSKSQELAESWNDQIRQKLAETQDLNELAATVGAEVENSPFMEAGAAVPGLPLQPQIRQRIVDAEVGDFLGPLDLNRAGTLYAVLTEKIPEHTGNFDAVIDDVRDELTAEKAKDLARSKANVVHSFLVDPDADWQTVANEQDVTVARTQPFARNEFVAQLGRDMDFQREAFALGEMITGPLMELNNGSFTIFRVVEFERASDEEFEEQYRQLKNTLLQSKQSSYVTWVIESLEQQAEQNGAIIDNRARFGLDTTS